MNAAIPIPPKTRERLANPAPPGERHQEAIKITAGLLSSGLSPDAVFCELRGRYALDFPDAEIHGIIDWSEKRFAGGNCPVLSFPASSGRNRFPRPEKPPGISPETAISRFLGGFMCDEADLWEASPIRLSERFETDAEALISALFLPSERVNVVSRFLLTGDKAQPAGLGETALRDKWLSRFRVNGPPVSNSGVWIRPNPMDGTGVSDRNVSAFRFALLEFDAVSMAVQLRFIARLPVAISAIISSGGKSLHAWVFIGAETETAFRESVAVLFRLIAPFGIDTANRNPSRLSRLPGVYRSIGAAGDGRQRLLYLNPAPKMEAILK